MNLSSESMSLIEYLGLDPSSVVRVIGESDWDPLEKMYLFSGKGPRSSSTHLGNYLNYKILEWVSKRRSLPVVFQISNDQKRFDPFIPMETARGYANDVKTVLETIPWETEFVLFENLDPGNYFLLKNYSDFLSSRVKLSRISKLLGDLTLFQGSYLTMQLAPLIHFGNGVFRGHRPLLIVASDQVGYFLIFRDICRKLGLKRPLIIEISPLKDVLLKNKMSSESPRYAIEFSEGGLGEIVKSLSDPSGERDFCVHLSDSFLPYLEVDRASRLRRLKSRYLERGESLVFKSQLTSFFRELLNSTYPLKFNKLFNLDLKETIPESNYVKGLY